MKRTRTLAVIAACFLGFGSIAPAHADETIGSGLVRIDGDWATVKTLADGSSVLTLARDAAGQWMGEIGPDDQLTVRDIDDERLVRGWQTLGHRGDAGVAATLTWNRGTNYALVSVSRPQLTPRGHLRFTLAPGTKLPARLSDVDINIVRSQPLQPRSFPVTETFALTATTAAKTSLQFAIAATTTLSDSGLSCFSSTVTQSAPQVELPANLACGSVTFTTGDYTLTLPSATQQGTVFFASTMATSASTFNFNAVIASWTTSGN